MATLESFLLRNASDISEAWEELEKIDNQMIRFASEYVEKFVDGLNSASGEKEDEWWYDADSLCFGLEKWNDGKKRNPSLTAYYQLVLQGKDGKLRSWIDDEEPNVGHGVGSMTRDKGWAVCLFLWDEDDTVVRKDMLEKIDPEELAACWPNFEGLLTKAFDKVFDTIKNRIKEDDEEVREMTE